MYVSIKNNLKNIEIIILIQKNVIYINIKNIK